MAVLPPSQGSPDWSGLPTRISTVIWSELNLVAGAGMIDGPFVDVSQWNNLLFRVDGLAAGQFAQIRFEFYQDAGKTFIIDRVYGVVKDTGTCIIQSPVLARYCQLRIEVGWLAGATGTFRLICQATTATQFPASVLAGAPSLAIWAAPINAGQQLMWEITKSIVGKVWVTVVPSATTWSLLFYGLNHFGVVAVNYATIDQTYGLKGVPFPVVVSNYWPEIFVTNYDGVARAVSLTVGYE